MKRLSRFLFLTVFTFIMIVYGCKQKSTHDFNELAVKNTDALILSMFFTAHAVDQFFSTDAGRREVVSLLRANGISKAYLEVYRGGLVVEPDLLKSATGFLEEQGFVVGGAIATVPGKDFGVHQEGVLGWFNWQNKKTQEDLKSVISAVAPIFNTFIIDDFLCTSDTSLESKAAKGEQSWSQYRRELLSHLSTELFIGPSKSINPDLHMIVKFPQWYDRFHLFGYDVVRKSDLYDAIWVGTETRGQYTQRFGFVQPYEGFINYRWLASIAGNKTEGAWFDHLDCDRQDFIEQAYQTVLAGAGEIIFFNYYNFIEGHPGHHLVRNEFSYLADLAKIIRDAPVIGVPAFKPPHSDAGGDLYIMDFMGMLGISLIPVSEYPENSKTIFLPTQAAADPGITDKVRKSLSQSVRIIATAGFLNSLGDEQLVREIAGLSWASDEMPSPAVEILADNQQINTILPLDLELPIETISAKSILNAVSGGKVIPFLTVNEKNNLFALNLHTFSQGDFDAVGEVLLSPKMLGLLEIPEYWSNIIREVFHHTIEFELIAPPRVSMQILDNGDVFIHNYNKNAVNIQLKPKQGFSAQYDEVFTNQKYALSDTEEISVQMGPRSKLWLKK
ncbi:MAG: hypothetical protein JJU28_23505 [Cyclobacteriaceae bacterium]|nr:hypothetical protein [Cyclobacteriaceae bacterium]